MREVNPYRQIVIEDPIFIDFIENREEELREATVKSYLQKILLYVSYTKKTPTELIDEAENEEETIRKLKNRSINRYLKGFSRELKSKGYSPQYRKTSLSIVKSFYNFHEVITPKIRCKIEKGNRQTTEDLINKEDIRKMVSNSNTEYQAIILLMQSSGMAPAEIRQLKLKYYLNALNINIEESFDIEKIINELNTKKDEIPTWNIRRVKTNIEYTTFSSSESVKAINLYLNDRSTYPNAYPEGYDSILFAPITVKGEVLNKQISRVTFSKYFHRLNKRCKFPEETGSYGLQCKCHAHNLRKFFATTLKNSGIDSLDVEWMIGHSIKPVTSAYELPDIKTLKKNYMKVLPYLTINEPVNLEIMENAEDITQLKLQSEIKDKKIDKLEERQELLEKMVQELMEKQLNDK